jgi:hypothetical protein
MQIKSSWTKPPEDQGLPLWGFYILYIFHISLKSDLDAAKCQDNLLNKPF